MDPDQCRRIETLYEAALVVEPARRAAFLEQNCAGDKSLRIEVESLLSNANAGGILEALEPHPHLESGQLVSHYEILEKLGEGGMGVVFRAFDHRLDRMVALKFPRTDELAGEEDRKRVLREARAASALDHPNIGAIYSIDEAPGGRLFIVMAYYDGETLAALIRRGPIPVAKAVDLAILVADALAAAHSMGIVHRDVKPANVVVTPNGVPKVVDFGLARKETGSTTLSLAARGTPSYMSPEQALGKRVDHRSDIWSFGVMLAEMITARRPFDRDNAQATLYSVMYAPPTGLDAVPPEMRRLISRALAKDPSERYQAMQEVIADLRDLQMPSDAAARPPAHGDLEACILRASATPEARAAAHARRRRQGALAAVVLAAALLGAVGFGLRHKFPGGFRAGYESYLNGVAALKRYDKSGNLDKAVASCDAARRADPKNALAFACLAQAYCLKSRVSKDASFLDLALSNAGRALELNNDLANGHVVLAEIQWSRGHPELAEQEQRRALELEPRNAEATFGLGRIYQAKGLHREAETYYSQAADMRPDSWEGYNNWGAFLLERGRWQEAAEQFRRVLELNPDNFFGTMNLGIAYLKQGRLDDAETLLQRAQQLDPSSYSAPAHLGIVYNNQGRPDLAAEAYQRALQLNPRIWQVWKNLAVARRWLNEHGAAVDAYRKAIPLLEKEVQVSSQNALLQARLAEMYAYSGQRAQAETWVRAALANDHPHNSAVLISCADAYAALGDIGRAVEIANLAVESGLTRESLKQDPEAGRFTNDPTFKLPDK
jgi:tetratricopeptide (TPR) repeat protein